MVLLAVPTQAFAISKSDYFQVNVVSARTGEGVPLTQLKTVNDIKFYTDSAGVAAIYEPGLMGEDVWLSVESPGYASFGPDWKKGIKVTLTPGGSRTIEIHPQNIAQRLYRQSGFSMYRDSHLLGLETPVKNPLLNTGKIMGQDSVNSAVFRGRVFWSWDDTQVLGNRWLSRGTGATSTLPSEGGLDPQKGVNLDYFVGSDGIAHFMFPDLNPPDIHDPNVWLTSLMVLEDNIGRQQMYAHYYILQENRMGVAKWNPNQEKFENLGRFPNDVDEMRVKPRGRAFRVRTDQQEWFYIADPYPLVRVPVTAEALQDIDHYQAMTPLEQGTSLSEGSIERDEEGNPVWGWKSNTTSLDKRPARLELQNLDNFDTQYGFSTFRNINTGENVRTPTGSVYWNNYRNKWVMIFQQAFGKFSVIGDYWYAEADSPIGPWVYARRIARHINHSCYNGKQNRMFDQLNGQRIFFQCSYATFAARGSKIPFYSYNQLMYKLNLSDTRLHLPTPVYHYQAPNGAHRYDTLKGLTARPRTAVAQSEANGIGANKGNGSTASNRSLPGELTSDSVAKDSPIPFYALPFDRPRPGSVPVWDNRVERGSVELTLDKPASARADSPAFYAFPPDSEVENPNLVEIHEYQNTITGRLVYSPSSPGSDWHQTRTAFLAWESPNKFPPREPGAEPVRTCMGASAHCGSSSDSSRVSK